MKESGYNKAPLSLMIHTHSFCPHVHKGGAVFEWTKSCDSKSKQKVTLTIEQLKKNGLTYFGHFFWRRGDWADHFFHISVDSGLQSGNAFHWSYRWGFNINQFWRGQRNFAGLKSYGEKFFSLLKTS